MKKFFFLFTCLYIIANHAIKAQSPGPKMDLFPQGTVLFGNIPYANDTLKKHLLDIYLPPIKKKSYPLIVWIHGGAWMLNDKYADMGYMANTLKAFADSGYAVASIDYRYSTTAAFPAQIQDCNEAVEFLYNNAARYSLDKDKIALIGFSAGGHVSASLALRHALPVYPHADAADALDAKPIVAAHLYPVITMGPGAHPGSHDKLLGETPAPAAVARYSLEKQVRAEAVPSFICLAADDDVVPPFENGITFFGALRAQKVPSELHVFEVGGHGFSLHWAAGKPCAAWPSLFTTWAATHGFKA